MCPECFWFVTSRGVSPSGLVFATDLPGVRAGAATQMNVERLPVRHHERVAVLLNANAGAVTERLRRELENFVPPEDIFYSRTLEDATPVASRARSWSADTRPCSPAAATARSWLT